MKKLVYIIALLPVFLACKQKTNSSEQPLHKKITQAIRTEDLSFLTGDSIRVFARLYHVADSLPVIVLCHQAGFNKAEYREIAPKLNALGFNCLAIDQRSGGTMKGGFTNQTVEFNKDKLPTMSRLESFISARPDIEAAINYAYNRYHQKVILWGSSYSATHALYQALENPKLKAIIAFSPGNYYNEFYYSIEPALKNLKIPAFITSSREESTAVKELLKFMPTDTWHIQFIPENKGKHGSKALWDNNPNHDEYWQALTSFLIQLKNLHD